MAQDPKAWKWPNKPFTQVVWWLGEWGGFGFYRWSGASACMFRWSIALGFVEFRRWRSWPEAAALFKAYGAREDK
jgi:hypothetical protein